MDYVQVLISNPDKLQTQLDAAIAAESMRTPDQEATSWLRVVDDCDRKCAKYQEMYAADMVTLDELSAKLQELDAAKSQAEEHLASARAGQSRVEELRATKKAMLEAYTAGIAYDGIRYFGPEMRREIYEALRLTVTVAKDGTPRMQGIADAQVIRLTRGVEDYGQEAAEYRSRLKLSSSNNSVTVMAEVAG